MPIYEFRCRECDAIEESLQKVNDPTPKVCSACGKHNALEKIVSQTSFQLKGGGWYSDLYSSTKKAETSNASSNSSPSSVSDSSGGESSTPKTATAPITPSSSGSS